MKNNEFNDIIGEITKNQKFQNSVDGLLEEKKEMDDIVSNITKNQKFQNNVDSILDNVKEEKNDSEQSMDFSEEEIKYMYSPYYQNYLYMLSSAPMVINSCISKIKQKYDFNNMMHQNPFNEKNELSYSINNIGYPVPKRFMEQYGTLISELLNNDTTFEDAIYEFEIIPIEYQEQRNKKMIKKVDTYQFHIFLKRNNKIKKI